MRNSSNTESMHGKTGKLKRSTCRQDSEGIPSEPHRKLRRSLPTVHVNSSRRRVARRRPLSGPAAVQQRAEITDGMGYELQPEGHADDSVDECEQVTEHSSVVNSSDGVRSVDECEQAAEHSSVDNSSDGDSEKCPICSVTFTTQEIATPDTCDHTFCAACLQELSQNENNCPVDKKMFNFILVRHRIDGEIITRIPVEPAERQGDCNREGSEPPCCRDTIGHCWILVFALTYVVAFWCAASVLTAHISH